MTASSSSSSAVASSSEAPATETLLRRRGELCAAAQFAALEGVGELAGDDDACAELRAIDAALRERGVDPHSA